MKAKAKPSNKRILLMGGAILITIAYGARQRFRAKEAPVITPVERVTSSVTPEDKNRALTLKMAVNLVKHKQYQGAKRILEDVLAAEPMNVSVLNNLAYVTGQLGEENVAAEYLHTALQIMPTCAECLNNLGTLLRKQGKSEEARKQFEEAVKLEPGQADARLNLAVLQEEQADWAHALASYREAEKIVSDPELRKWVLQRVAWLSEVTQGAVREIAGGGK